jgi:hypothetical protein
MGNLPTGDRVVIRTGLPTVYWRQFNQGIAPSKSTTAQVDEACGMMEARSEVDVDLAKLNGETAAFRLTEDIAFLEAMNQTFSTTLFYGNPSVDPKQFMGLAPRYSLTTAGNGQNIITAGGATANVQSSIWLVNWSDHTIYCPFPKGMPSGLTHQNLGEQTVFGGVSGTSVTERMQALVSLYQWKVGLSVKDWRHAVRIPNVEATLLSGFTGVQSLTSYATNLIHVMAKAVARIPTFSIGKKCFYMNRTVYSGLMRMALEKSSSALGISAGLTQFGQPGAMLSFLGIPIRQCDALLNTEAVVS